MQRITILQPVRSTAPDANYPDGSAQNESIVGANDGTPFELARSNDIFGMQQALLHQLGLTPNGLAETALLSQFLEGVVRLGSVGDFYVESGAINIYVATQFGSVQPRLAYFDGMEILFKAVNTNTGVSTIDVDGLGVRALTLANGAALSGGEVPAGEYTRAKYNLGLTRFELILRVAPIRREFASTGQVITSAGQLILPHGMGAEPKLVQFILQNTTAEGGYSIGDRVITEQGSSSALQSTVIDATNITIRYSSTAQVFVIGNKSTGSSFSITPANWQLYVRAFS